MFNSILKAYQQTWENPNYISPYTSKKGDNDPIDVIEIGQSVATVGQIKQVKILGIIGLLDQDETDWKVVVIDANDPLSDKINGMILNSWEVQADVYKMTFCLYRY